MAAVCNSLSRHVMENIQEQLTCAICLDRLVNPKFLSCLHTFCEQCIHLINNEESREVLICPTCRAETKIPDNGVNGLRTNFFINSMLDLVQLKFEETKKEKKKVDQCDQCKEHENAISR